MLPLGFWVTCSAVQFLLLDLCSGNRKPHGMSGTRPMRATCKTNAISAILSAGPLIFIFFQFYHLSKYIISKWLSPGKVSCRLKFSHVKKSSIVSVKKEDSGIERLYSVWNYLSFRELRPSKTFCGIE